MTKQSLPTPLLTIAVTLLITILVFATANATPLNQTAYRISSPLPTPVHLPNVIRGLNLPSDVRTRQAQIASGNLANGLPWSRTSDYMLGTVSVAIILPQCVGSGCTESWTTGEIGQIGSAVQAALQWWQQKAAVAGAQVQFQVIPGQPLVVPVNSVEPINVPGGNSLAMCGDEGQWITPVMTNLGFNRYPSAGVGYLDNVRDYDNSLRQTYHTDWAFAVFVADASNDAVTDFDLTNPDPNKRYDGRGLFKLTTCGGSLPLPGFGVSGYGWFTGPHMVMNNVNDGYGSVFMDGVAAMEIGHIFGAPDELNSSDACMPPGQGKSCNDLWGYLNIANGNCRYVSDPAQQTCMLNDNLSIMRYPENYGSGSTISNTVNSYTYGHIGWKDSNSNGIPDPIDTIPTVTLNAYTPNPTSNRTPIFTGLAQDAPVHTSNPNYTDLNINHLRVEYRVNAGTWTAALPVDASNPYTEAFTFSPLLCANSTYTIEVHAINSVGHVSAGAGTQLTISSTTPCRIGYLPIVMKTGSSGGAQYIQPSLLPAPFASPLPQP